jgi:hypothetical protein
MLQSLTYELEVLGKAVHHKNLSAAAVHIGLSQPQLSRVISKIERELNITLLDRSARRKSGWTHLAQELAVAYSKGFGRLESEILALAQEMERTELHIGTLEGLSAIAMNFAQDCFSSLKMKSVYLDVFDFGDLDSQFLSNNLDLAFTVRLPSQRKFSHVLEVGYQQVEKISTDKKIIVASPFEFSATDKKNLDETTQAFVSNSLDMRRRWLKEMGGTGILPVDAKTGKGRGPYTIYALGSELLSPRLWKSICDIFEN